MTIIAGSLVFLLALTALVAVHEWGHYLAARACGVRVLRFSVGFGRALGQRTSTGGTRWQIGWLPLGGLVELARDPGRLSARQRERQGEVAASETFDQCPAMGKAVIALAGPAMNLVLAFGIYGVLEAMPRLVVPPVVDAVEARGWAAQAGFRPGDRVIAVEGRPVSHWGEVTVALLSALGQPKTLLQVRSADEAPGETRLIAVPTAKLSVSRESRWILAGSGLRPAHADTLAAEALEHRDPAAGKAIAAAARATWRDVRLTLAVGHALITGNLSLETLSSPIGAGAVATEVLGLGWMAYLAFVALFSVNLAVFNLLPVPGLDGGHVVFAGRERVRGRRLGARTETIAVRVGFSLLIALGVFAIGQDLWYLLAAGDGR